MNLDSYIKTILSGVKTWAQSTFAKKSDVKDMYYDNRTSATTEEVTVNGTAIERGYIKVADTLDFDITTVMHISRYGNDGANLINVPVEITQDYGNAVDICAPFNGDWYCWATYFPTQNDADKWYGDSYNNPFSAGLYMWLNVDSGERVSVAYSFTYQKGELRKIDPKYVDVPLATEYEAGAVHPWINEEYGQSVWMHPETGELFTYESTYTLPVAAYNVLGGVKPVTKVSAMSKDVGVDGDGRLYTNATGESTARKAYTIDNKTVYASNGAEIFNDYSGSTKAIGMYSHAEGSNTIASGDHSHAEGYYTTASGGSSHAEGYNATASNNYSHAEGCDTEASGYTSHAEGYNTTASGDYSHAEGLSTIASGIYSHAEGTGTTASGGSHAEGRDTTASGNYSHTEGLSTTASGSCQHTQGKYNIDDIAGIYAHIVGNGNTSTKSNAHTLDWEGNAWFQGDIYVGSTSGKNKDDGSKKIATIDDIETAINAIPSAQADWEEIDETSAAYIKNKPKIGIDYIVLSDSNSGFNYAISVSNGNLVASQIYELDYIKIITMPNKLDYIEGEPIDLTGLSLNVVYKNGDEKSVTNYDINVDYASSSINIIYKEYGISVGVEIQINVTPFDPSVVLVDFDYTSNSDGTYTITGWKGTYNGVSSTELIIPDNSLIVL